MADETRFAELADFERNLASLVPQVDGVDRDELLFLAGQQSVSASRGRWLWPTTTALSTLAAAVLTVMLWVQNAGDPNQRIRPDQANAPTDESPSMVPDQPADPRGRLRLAAEDPLAPSYFRLRQIALASGIDAMPDPLGQPTSPVEPSRPFRAIEGRHYKFD